MPTNCESVSSSMLGQTANNPPPNRPRTPESFPAIYNKAVVVGLYGVPGSGKTSLLAELKGKLGEEHFAFYEGSEMITRVFPGLGGLGEFQKLEEQEKMTWRELAIDEIEKECAESRKVAIVSGHFMFWPEEDEAGSPVYTSHDMKTYTHILYLDIPAEVVAQRRLNDTKKSRPSTSIYHLDKWQREEKNELHQLCREHGILFSLLSSHSALLNQVVTLLGDFRIHTENYNLCQVVNRLEEALFSSGKDKLETVLLIDATGHWLLRIRVRCSGRDFMTVGGFSRSNLCSAAIWATRTRPFARLHCCMKKRPTIKSLMSSAKT